MRGSKLITRDELLEFPIGRILPQKKQNDLGVLKDGFRE